MRPITKWSLGVLAMAALVPRSAEACGGTFCDSGPVAMPVDQTGENVLFVMSGGSVEAHVQIQYEGAAERFAWVIPLQAIPEFSVGSDPLFQSLLSSTVPSFGFSVSRDVCETNTDMAASGNGGSGGGGLLDAGTSGGVNVVSREAVGAFEISVLQGGSATEVTQWLDDNGYQQSDMAPDILADYVKHGFLFAAVKLNGNADVDEIHPLVFRFAGNEPCVPLKLTRIAAVEDMGVRTFFLGNGRFVPTNYKHVTLNWLKLDWLNRGTNYNDLVSAAADSKVADGQAFVTEYAGPSSIVTPSGVYSTQWNAAKFANIDPSQVTDELAVQGFGSCNTSMGCQFSHPLVISLLEEFLPRPAGLSDEEFYGCLSCYQGQIDLSAWDAQAFADRFQERIVDPGLHAQEILAQNPYLTRMYTTISPSEMTRDPMFHERADLAEVPLPGFAQQRITCSGASVFTLPDGRQVALPAGATTWPEFENQPAAATIEEVPEQGDPIVLVDNTDKIQQSLQKHNSELSADPQANGCACSTPGGRVSMGGLFALGALTIGLGMRRRRRRESDLR